MPQTRHHTVIEAPAPLPPGDGLLRQISSLAEQDRPGYYGLSQHIPEFEDIGQPARSIRLRIPRLDLTAERHDFRSEHPALKEGTFGPAEFRAFIDTGHPSAEYLCSHSKSALVRLRELSAAAWFDIGDADKDRLEEMLEGTRTDIDRDIRKGRKLAVKIGAWPWWAIKATFAEGYGGGEPPEPWDFRNQLPARWWELPRVVATFEAWALGSQKPLYRHDAEHGFPSPYAA